MYRFFVEKKLENKFELSNDVLKHLKAIRLKSDEKFYCIFENEYYLCYFKDNYAFIESKEEINHEYDFELVLFASIINIKRFEWLVQKATELGVKDFYPMITKNTNQNLVFQVEKKISRFQEISKNASEQSFRNTIMKVHNPILFEEAINYKIDKKYIAHEKENKNYCLNEFSGNIAFYVGPEGGFESEEINIAKKKNTETISLGKRILRSETASIFLLSRVKP